jgi:hypothetical protein
MEQYFYEKTKYLNYEKTKYPNIFKNVYWGKNKNDNSLIFENRNKFVEHYKIKKSLDKSKRNIRFLLNIEFIDITYYCNYPNLREFKYQELKHNRYADHIEVYETEDNKIIVLASPNISKDKKLLKFIEKNSFINTDLLYSNNAVSFYKIFKKNETTIKYLTAKLNM